MQSSVNFCKREPTCVVADQLQKHGQSQHAGKETMFAATGLTINSSFANVDPHLRQWYMTGQQVYRYCKLMCLYLAHGLLRDAIAKLRMQVAVADDRRKSWAFSHSIRRVIASEEEMRGLMNVREAALRGDSLRKCSC